MLKADVKLVLERAENIAKEVESFVPNTPTSLQFRADLAGLLVVAMAASYEACVKDVMFDFANRHHSQFGFFTQNHFNRLNSKIRLNDLYKYARTFDSGVHDRFGRIIQIRKSRISRLVGQDITKSYDQILSWRHDFAHAGLRNTTVEEAIRTHRIAKWVLYSFADAFM